MMKATTRPSLGVVLVAAGRSTRMAGLDKQFVLLGDRPVLSHALQPLRIHPAVTAIVVVAAPERCAEVAGLIGADAPGAGPIQVVAGGVRRQDSVRLGVEALPAVELVLIHDGARPFLSTAIIDRALAAVATAVAAIAVTPVTDTIKRVAADGRIIATPARHELRAAQTPQIFQRSALLGAYAAIDWSQEFTDEAGLLEATGAPVGTFLGAADNLKITTPHDLTVARALWQEQAGEGMGGMTQLPRVGTGYDIHRLVEGRRLVLGGVEIASPVGLLGHSDADVLTHAVMDALLGAVALGDIGHHFPPSDERWRDADSLLLLSRVVALLAEQGWQVGNIDCTVVLERPKIAPYLPVMRRRLATTLGVDESAVSIKATTSEGLGLIGRGEGASAQAVAIVTRSSQ